MDRNGCSIGTHILSYKPRSVLICTASKIAEERLHDVELYLRDDDVVLVTYSEDSNEDGGPHFQRFCFDIGGVRDVAQLYIDALYELDRYVSRLRKKDFE